MKTAKAVAYWGFVAVLSLVISIPFFVLFVLPYLAIPFAFLFPE